MFPGLKLDRVFILASAHNQRIGRQSFKKRRSYGRSIIGLRALRTAKFVSRLQPSLLTLSSFLA